MAANPKKRNVDGLVNDTDRLHMGWTIVRISALILALMLVNRYSDRIGVIVSAGDSARFVPLLPPEILDTLLLRLNIWWGLSLALYVANLWVGHWMWGTRLLDYALAFFGMFILAKTISSPLLGISTRWLQPGQSALSLAQRLLPLLTWLVRGSLAAALIGWLVLLAVKLQTLHRTTSLTPA